MKTRRMNVCRKVAALGALASALLAVQPVLAFSVDGRLDSSSATTDAAAFAEGYTQVYDLTYAVQNVPGTTPGGKLYVGQDANYVYLFFSQPTDIVDNSYGAGSIGWGSAAPSTKNHNFNDLVGSDKMSLTFADSGNTTLDVVVDYITQSGSQYVSGGVTAGDGKVNSGSATSVVASASSLQWDLNSSQSKDNATGIDLTHDSPGCNSDGTNGPCSLNNDYANVNSNFSDWIFNVNYELQLDKASVFPNGFSSGSISLGVVHDSPNKLGGNQVTFTCGSSGTVDLSNPSTTCGYTHGGGSSVPEPPTVLVFAAALLGLALDRHRRAGGRNRAAA